MKRLLLSVPLLLFVLLSLFGAAHAAGGVEFSYFAVSAPRLRLGPNESVDEYSFETMGAVVIDTKVPFQWSMEIDNSEGARTHLHAFANVGNSVLYNNDLKFFQRFVTIAKLVDAQMGFDFDLKLTLTIHDKNDKERKVTMSLVKMQLIPLARPLGKFCTGHDAGTV